MSAHQLQADHLPTPFTAAQIRDATPAGRTIDTVTERDGVVVERMRRTFVTVDAERAQILFEPLDQACEVTGEGRETATWLDLQAHASFPAAIAHRVEAAVPGPDGDEPGWRYRVDRGERAVTLWFASARPGMPVRYGSRTADGTQEEWTWITSVADRPARS